MCSDLATEAKNLGNSKTFSDNATWTLAVGAGMLTNVTYCTYLLYKVQFSAVCGTAHLTM